MIAEVPSTASPLAQQIWRGIHEGAHLDHLSALITIRPAALGPAAPSPAEFGAGLMVAESYAMAVEIVAAVECIMAEEGHAVWQLGAGLIERASRLPGGSDPAPEFSYLPTLAEVYVRGPLEVLTGGGAARVLPEQLAGSLRARWRSACAAYPPAAAFGSAATELLDRSPRCIPDIYRGFALTRRGMRVPAGVCTWAGCSGAGLRPGLKAVHNVTVHAPLAAVGWPLPAEPPAGACHDATAYCR